MGNRHRSLARLAAVASTAVLAGCFLAVRQAPGPRQVDVPVDVRPLPGGLDAVPLFDSNSPEVIDRPGILVSTEDGVGGLDYPFTGDLRLLSHHIARDVAPGARHLRLELWARAVGPGPAQVRIVRGVSFLSQPDAPFVPMAALVDDPDGLVYAGPGDRAAVAFLHGQAPAGDPSAGLRPGVELGPGEAQPVYSLPIPTTVAVGPPLNGRTTLLDLHVDGAVQLAERAVFTDEATASWTPDELAIPSSESIAALTAGDLAGPREATPSTWPRVAHATGSLHLGRVAGVAKGTTWSGTLLPQDAADPLPAGTVLGFPLASTAFSNFGTGQDQSAPLLRRYPDTAHRAWGNYGVTYVLHVPLRNPGAASRQVAFALTQPVRTLRGRDGRTVVRYLDPPTAATAFRGEVRLDLEGLGDATPRFAHLVLHAGEQAPPFAEVTVAPGTAATATLTLIYPPDSTPPQLLTVSAH